MGVDFDFYTVRVENGVVHRVPDAPRFFCSYSRLWPLFLKNEYANEREPVERLLPHKIDFSFFEQALVYGSNEDLNIYFNPNTVLDTLQTIKDTIELHRDDLPIFYWFGKNNKIISSSLTVFVNGRKGWLNGGWNQCTFHHQGSNAVDLSEQKIFRCRELINEKQGNEWIEIEGPEIIIEIYKETFAEHFGPALDEMIKICLFAKAKGYMIQTRHDP